MRIVINRMKLENFKCFREKEIDFSEKVTTITGRNGVGKTTIADAILWCLFGKNTQGQADFDLKTHGEDNLPIPNIDHSVELQLSVDSSPVTIKRSLKEQWTKKRGSDVMVFKNNNTEFLVNGQDYKPTDYKKYISELIDEYIFRTITNPTHFTALPWKEQREFLTKMVPDVSAEDIACQDNDLQALANYLLTNEEEVAAYLQHLSYRKKGIKERLDKIPVRLEEQNKALPEKLDWDSLQMEYDNAVSGLKEVNDKILAIKSGNGDEFQRASIRAEIKETQDSLDMVEGAFRSTIRSMIEGKENKIAEASRKFNQLLNTQRELEAAIQSFDMLSKRCRETADETFKKEQAYIRENWKQTQVEFSQEQDGRCKLCGQILPPEQLEKARESFNKYKAELKQSLTERANKAKQLLADAENEAKDFEAKREEAEKKLAETKQAINDTFSEKAKIEKEPIKSLEEFLAEDENYQSLLAKKNELLQKLEDASKQENNVELLDAQEKMKTSLEDGIKTLSAQLATKTQYEKGLSLIEGIRKEEKDLITQLSELEKKEDVARRYEDRQNTILEERINEHFHLVKWKLFETVNNGGEPFNKPFCECYVDGVAYHDGLNQAARLNAGLDIINTLCRHYNVSAPIVLDNAESTINILDTIGQQIRLHVADTDLQII